MDRKYERSGWVTWPVDTMADFEEGYYWASRTELTVEIGYFMPDEGWEWPGSNSDAEPLWLYPIRLRCPVHFHEPAP